MAVKRKYRLNLRNYGNLPAIMLSQYDEGYALEFEIRDGTDAASDLSAYTVTLKGTRADTLAYSFAGTVSTNVLTFVIDTTMTACAGRGTAEIAIKDTANDVLFATFNMPVFVERAAVPEGSIDADVERAQEIAEQVQEIVDNAAAAVSGEAEKWATGQINGTDVPSTDPAYENNAKYYAEQAAESAASIGIDATLTQAGKAADAKKTGDEISALKEDLDDIQEVTIGKNLYNPQTQNIGILTYTGEVNPNLDEYKTSDFIPVESGESYFLSSRISGVIQKTRYLSIAFDENKSIIAESFQNVDATTGLLISVPNGGVYIKASAHSGEAGLIQVEKGNAATSFEEYTKTVLISAGLGTTPTNQVENIVDEKIADSGLIAKEVRKNLVPTTGFVTGGILSDGNIYTGGVFVNYETSGFIEVENNTDYVLSTFDSSSFIVSTTRKLVNVFDVSKTPVADKYYNIDGEIDVTFNTGATGKYVRIASQKAVLKQLEKGTVHSGYSEFEERDVINLPLGTIPFSQTDNLSGKKWAVCGDSFTAGALTTKILTGKYAGQKNVYPYIIGNRTGIDVIKFFEGGQTLAFPAEPGEFANSLTNPTGAHYYQTIPSDADYITIYLGINDEHHSPGSSGGDGEDNTGKIPLGTIEDDTTATYFGAWNVVLSWLIVNRPNAHIGIIVTNGIAGNDNYRLAQIAIAQKYGIPYIDLNGDSRTPAMLRTSNPNIPATIKTALIQKWAVNPSTNTHPNDVAHEFESTSIENFLRSL